VPLTVWLADVREVPGCSVSGQTLTEARARVSGALSVYVEDVASVEIEEEIHGWLRRRTTP
jgi:predicted RNase H-like HicB family nuclease